MARGTASRPTTPRKRTTWCNATTVVWFNIPIRRMNTTMEPMLRALVVVFAVAFIPFESGAEPAHGTSSVRLRLGLQAFPQPSPIRARAWHPVCRSECQWRHFSTTQVMLRCTFMSWLCDTAVQLVELKTGETYNGTLVAVDMWMNLSLSDVICTSRDGEKFWRMPAAYIRGNSIKYLRIPDEVLEKVPADEDLVPSGGGRGRGTDRCVCARVCACAFEGVRLLHSLAWLCPYWSLRFTVCPRRVPVRLRRAIITHHAFIPGVCLVQTQLPGRPPWWWCWWQQ